MPIANNHYQDRHVYFYVPSDPKDPSISTDDRGLGVFFRLGEYSDIEHTNSENSTNGQPTILQNQFYPYQHNKDAGSADEALKLAPGQDSSGLPKNGILLTCDGRFLLKAGEKMYTQVLGDKHDDIDGSYTLDVEKDITIDSRSGKIVLETGADIGEPTRKTLNARDIVISADNGNADLVEIVNNETKNVGHDSKDIIKGDKTSEIHGTSKSFVIGTKHIYTHGKKFERSYGVSFSMNASADFAFKTFAVGFTTAEISLKAFDFGYKALSISGEKLKLSWGEFAAKFYTANITLDDLSLSEQLVEVNSTDIGAQAIDLKSEIGNIKTALRTAGIYVSDATVVL